MWIWVGGKLRLGVEGRWRKYPEPAQRHADAQDMCGKTVCVSLCNNGMRAGTESLGCE